MARPGKPDRPSDGGAEAGKDHGDVPEGAIASVTTYESTPTGHRVTRRSIHRTETTRSLEENTEETVTEDYPAPLYEAPASDHPAPVG
jgi:hypothetical protein